MTGTDFCVNIHNQSRSYLNHLVYIFLWSLQNINTKSVCKLPIQSLTLTRMSGYTVVLDICQVYWPVNSDSPCVTMLLFFY
jgi:hypothetical protein